MSEHTAPEADAAALREAHEDGYWIGYREGKDEAETRDLNYDAMTDRAQAAEAARASLLEVLDAYFDFDADPWEDHDVACPAPEDLWRLHRDLRALLAADHREADR